MAILRTRSLLKIFCSNRMTETVGCVQMAPSSRLSEMLGSSGTDSQKPRAQEKHFGIHRCCKSPIALLPFVFMRIRVVTNPPNDYLDMVTDSLIQLLPFKTQDSIFLPHSITYLSMPHHLIPSRFVGSSWVSVYQLPLVTFDASILILRMIVRWIEKRVLFIGRSRKQRLHLHIPIKYI